MKLPLITKDCSDYAEEKLNKYYKNDFIVSEKKSYLTDLENSTGPYLCVKNQHGSNHYLMDCASQIASLGLGFNPTSFQGVGHFLESYTNNPNGELFQNLLNSYHQFLKRKLNSDKLTIHYRNSGAESIETALGLAFNKRKHKKQTKVLAFEGSFHGRLLVSLASTWNKTKREPFVFEGFETTFLASPSLDDGNIHREIPKDWISTFENSVLKKFQIPKFKSPDQKQLNHELKCLKEVVKELSFGNLFAVVIEPMQCEGGDQYFSSRFISALLSICKSFEIPFIFDEVQTGFHLGKDFFWHQTFSLKTSDNKSLYPDYVVCAKKAQSGMVLELKNNIKKSELGEVNIASIIRGYYHGLMLDQSFYKIKKLEENWQKPLSKLVNRFNKHLGAARGMGLAFAFDLKDKEKVKEFIAKRFLHGLLFYPAGSSTLRFRLNTSFSKKDIDFLFDRLTGLCSDIFEEKKPIIPKYFPEQNETFKKVSLFQDLLLSYKLKAYSGGIIKESEVLVNINKYFSKHSKGEIKIIDSKLFSKIKSKIEKLEEEVYEASRQTDIENFYNCIQSKFGLAIGLFEGEKLLGISFCSSLKDHPFERGVRRDKNYSNLNSVYMLDTTISPSSKGHGIGRDIKYALSLILLARGCKSISGRNRDKMATPMLSINTSLGAFELEYIKEDYPDMEEFRDVVYYSHELQWKGEEINLSLKNQSPLLNYTPTIEHIKKTRAILNNKICLSNFVSEQFLSNLKDIGNDLPKELQHFYTTSGQSECVDKIIKSLWFNRKSESQEHTLLTFEGHFFGNGSFLARDLGQLHNDSFFPVLRLKNPSIENYKEILKLIKNELEKNKIFSIWLEPILQNSLEEVPIEFLTELISLSKDFNIPVIFNETASSSYRYDINNQYCSSIKNLTPTGGMQYLGGQTGICFLNQEYFIKAPLMVISTWDGDELSLYNYHQALNLIKQSDYKEILTNFETLLKEFLSHFKIYDLTIKNGRGSFKGLLPTSLQSFFVLKNGRYLIDPSVYSIKRFIKEFSLIKEKYSGDN